MSQVTTLATARRVAFVLALLAVSCADADPPVSLLSPTSQAPTSQAPTKAAPTTAPELTTSTIARDGGVEEVNIDSVFAATRFDTFVYLGDSLAEESELFLPALLGGVTYISHTVGGSAPCDWLDMQLPSTPTTVIVLTFHGNSYTPCMSDGPGSFYVGEAIVDRYYRDVGDLIDLARVGGATVVLVGQPEDGPFTTVASGVIPQLNAMYERLAAERGIRFVDAGAALETPDGSYADRLPCRVDEAQCGPDGMNGMRHHDGQHFCPGPQLLAPCRAYAAGAYRFAKAIVDAVIAAEQPRA